MSQQQNTSEVAALRQRIELECQALTMLRDKPATVAQHRIITHRYHSLDKHCEALEKLVGEEAATDLIFAIYSKEVQ